MFAKGRIHCEYCQCPLEVWKPFLRAFNGDGCKLYDDFTNVIWELEKAIRPFNNQDILNECQKDFKKQYTDISDFEDAINEMIEINHSEGFMPANYRSLSICK